MLYEKIYVVLKDLYFTVLTNKMEEYKMEEYKMEEYKMEEYKGSGSVHGIFEWYAKQELDASGSRPVFVKPEMIEKKRKSA